RVARLRRQHYDDRAYFDAVVEVNHVLIRHADAAGGDGRTDILRLIGAVDSIQSILIAGIKVQRTSAHRISWTARKEVRNCFEGSKPPLFPGCGRPGGPFRLAADLGHARPGERFFANDNAVADRLAVPEDIVEIARIGIDEDRARSLLTMVWYDRPLVGGRNARPRIRCAA